MWLWDSPLLLDKHLQGDESENTTMTVIKRVLASTDHYTTLGILQTADQHRIKEAYGALHRLLGESRAIHPDMKDALKKVERAVEVLGDPSERRAYDKLLASAAANGVGGVWAPHGGHQDTTSTHKGHMLACGVCGKAHRRVLVDRLLTLAQTPTEFESCCGTGCLKFNLALILVVTSATLPYTQHPLMSPSYHKTPPPTLTLPHYCQTRRLLLTLP